MIPEYKYRTDFDNSVNGIAIAWKNKVGDVILRHAVHCFQPPNERKRKELESMLYLHTVKWINLEKECINFRLRMAIFMDFLGIRPLWIRFFS